MFGLQCLIHPCPQFTYMQSSTMLSIVSALPHDCSISPLAQVWSLNFDIEFIQGSSVHILYELATQNLNARAVVGPAAYSKSEKQKSRLLILALPLFWSGSAHTEKWLLPLPCHTAIHKTKEGGGLWVTPSCHWDMQFLFWKQKQILVSTDITLPPKCTGFCHLKYWQKLSYRITELFRLKKIFENREYSH